MSNLAVIAGGAGSGKTEFLVDVAARRYESDPFATTLRHADQFRRRLVERCGVALALEVSTIGVFAQRFARDEHLVASDVTAELLNRVSAQRIVSGDEDGEETFHLPHPIALSPPARGTRSSALG